MPQSARERSQRRLHRRTQVLNITASILLRFFPRPDTPKDPANRSPKPLMTNSLELLTAAVQSSFAYQQAFFTPEIDVPAPAVVCIIPVRVVETQMDKCSIYPSLALERGFLLA